MSAIPGPARSAVTGPPERSPPWWKVLRHDRLALITAYPFRLLAWPSDRWVSGFFSNDRYGEPIALSPAVWERVIQLPEADLQALAAGRLHRALPA